jgi:hypothetical protein
MAKRALTHPYKKDIQRNATSICFSCSGHYKQERERCSLFVYLLPKGVLGAAGISNLRGNAGGTKGEGVHPLSVGLSVALAELDKVSSAVISRKQFGVGHVHVTDLGGLDILGADASAVTTVIVESHSLVGVVVDVNVVVSLGKSTGGEESQQSDRLVHFG